MTEQHDRRLIEDSLPLEAISYQSAREKSIRHGHISTLHIWWARRPLAAMRAAIFAALMPAPKDEEERVQMHRLIGGTYNAESGKWEGGICDWDSVKNGNDATIQQARELIHRHYPDAPPKVLDPFMGGGSTGLEALRLGAEAHGVELNPVAHIIELCTLVYPQKYGQKITREEYEARPGTLPPVEHMAAYVDDDYDEDEDGDPEQQSFDFDTDEMVNPLAEDVERWGHWVLEEARNEVGRFYIDHIEGKTVVATLWARTAKCPNPTCGAKMPLIRQTWLSRKKKIAYKPVVDPKTRDVSFVVKKGDEIDFDPTDMSMQQGSVTCFVCGHATDSDYLQNEGKANRIDYTPVAVVLNGENGKEYRSVTNDDIELYRLAEKALSEWTSVDPDAIPNEPISVEQPRIIWVILYGLKYWRDLFNSRQLLTLLTFKSKIREVHSKLMDEGYDHDYAKAIVTYLALGLDRIANQGNTICRWNNARETLEGVYARQAIPIVWDYPESNPFSESTGNWAGALEWITRVIKHTGLASSQYASLVRATSTRMPHENQSVEAVITDPPYYDSVPYSDLSDFFYVWLKRSIGDLYPAEFQTPVTPKSAEIVEQRPHSSLKSRKDKEFYETELTKAFSESHRVLKREGVFVVVFAHKSTSAWETLLNGLLESGLVVTASWPLNTEMSARMIAQGNAALASSIFIVCRKRIAETDGVYDDVRPLMKNRIKERLDYFWKQGIRGADFFISAIGPAVEVFGQYKTVRKLSGDVVTVAELLDIVQQEVADYALSQVMNGGAAFGPFDAATRFYIMYRWSYGKNKIEFDDGMRLAMALGAEVDALMHASSVLKKSGSSVTLLGPYDREKNEKLGEPARDRMAAPLIDMVHRSALLWRAGKREELARYVSTHVGTRVEALRAVAQALVNVLPDGDKEKQLYEGFLQGELPTAPTTQQLFSDEDFK